FTFNFSEAFTHTGVLATYSASDDVTLYGGWTLGWDTGYDQLNGGSSFLGGASVNLVDGLNVTYITTFGDLGWMGDNAYSHSVVAIADLTDEIQYVFQSDLIGADNSAASNGGHYDTIGINQYLFYTVNDCVKAGARIEWWKADGVSVNEMAFGVNYKPHANVVVRPEIRYNWCPSDTLPYVMDSLGMNDAYLNQTIFGCDVILTF
ncbi:MAG: outer membrane beta-barrel protein, partial [Planctomycetales bacterium]|nr:outer membrane beta-barrel protein [Planctomycetales bacterium]